MFNLPRIKIPFYATWAKINKPFSTEKHYVEDGAICYDTVQGEAYANHIEMAGEYVASIISYGCDSYGNLKVMRHVTFPTLRYYPNKTHDSVDYNYKGYLIKVGGKALVERVQRFVFDGIIHIFSRADELSVTRKLFPASSSRALCEIVEFANDSSVDKAVHICALDRKKNTLACHGKDRQIYTFDVKYSAQSIVVPAHSSRAIYIAYCGEPKGSSTPIDVLSEYKARQEFIRSIDNKLVISSDDSTLNLMARYAKLRASESIFMTKSGLMHCPGGGGYYAAVWTNDQCEYVNPFFAYLGYEKGIEQSKNCYNLYKSYISEDKALITSIISEGDGIWHGVGDRGDSAMYAYGASRFLLTMGDQDLAKQYIDYIDKCLTFTISQIGEHGVIKSDSDELENRFESGSANLCTSCIAYDALISASYLHGELGNFSQADYYTEVANCLRENIEKYFGKEVEGYHTYRYCEEEQALRSWIAMPLVVGIFDRATDTKNALLSDKLRVNEGLVTRSSEKTFWDRSTLYTLRGLFNAGFGDEAYELMSNYTRARLLGEHIPYAVEAFPEGNQAQLSAESGLYIRIIVEGILGYRPVGFGKFVLNYHLPEALNKLKISHFSTFGQSIDIAVDRQQITITTPTKTIIASRGEVINLADQS